MMRHSEKEIEYVLQGICVTYGICLPHKVRSRLCMFPPKDKNAFAKAVIEAEGLTIETIDKHLYQAILLEIGVLFKSE